jgi:hypothetical protein
VIYMKKLYTLRGRLHGALSTPQGWTQPC